MLRSHKILTFVFLFILSACVHHTSVDTSKSGITLGGVACKKDAYKNFRLIAAQVQNPAKLKDIVEDIQKNHPNIGVYLEQPLMETQWIKPLKDLGFVIETVVSDQEIAVWLFRNGRDIPQFSHTTHGAITAIYCPTTKRFLFIFETAKDFWTVPGGGVDPGMLASATATKEVWEETGIKLTSTPRLIAVLGRAHKDAKLGHINGIAQIFFATVPKEIGQPDGKETTRIKWVSLSEIQSGKIDGYPINPLVVAVTSLMKAPIKPGQYVPSRPGAKDAELAILANFKDLDVATK